MEIDVKMIEQLQRYYILWRESNAMYEAWAKRHELSLNSFLVLYALCEESGGYTQKLISQKWFIPKQTVNAVLKEFEIKGYIELIPVTSDKRRKQVCLTARGKRFAEKIISELHAQELRVMGEMGLEKMKRMNDDLSLFIEIFCRGNKENE